MFTHEQKEQGARRFFYKSWVDCDLSERANVVSRLNAELNSYLPKSSIPSSPRGEEFIAEYTQRKADEQKLWKSIAERHEKNRLQKIRDAELMRLYQTDRIAWAKEKRADFLKNNPNFENLGKAE